MHLLVAPRHKAAIIVNALILRLGMAKTLEQDLSMTLPHLHATSRREQKCESRLLRPWNGNTLVKFATDFTKIPSILEVNFECV